MSAALRVFEHNLLVYRRSWRGSVMVSFISPLFFLTAMGIGLGSLVNRGGGGVAGVPYILFLAPGLLATTAMQTGAIEMTYPIMAKVYWERTYEGMLATPIKVRDLLAGEALWILARLLLVESLFFAVMLIFRIPRTPVAGLAIFAAVLTGMAFAMPIMAFSALQKNDSGFAVLQRFVIMPLFLFGGAFFPVTRLPAVLQAVAWLTPLSHGVALTRGLTLGHLELGAAAIDLGVMLVYVVGGLVAASMTLRRRLVN
jgi:lipooligosaccharide transport system permease protein